MIVTQRDQIAHSRWWRWWVAKQTQPQARLAPLPCRTVGGDGDRPNATVGCLCCISQSCRLFATMDCSPPGSSVREIIQAGMLEWAAISFPRGSFQPRDWTCVSYVSCMAGRCFTCRATGEAKGRRYQDTKIRYFRRNQQCSSLFQGLQDSQFSFWALSVEMEPLEREIDNRREVALKCPLKCWTLWFNYNNADQLCEHSLWCDSLGSQGKGRSP